MTSITSELVKDKTTWLGTIGSVVSTSVAAMEAKNWLPQDLQGWLAATLSFVTIIYIATKVAVVVHDRHHGKKLTPRQRAKKVAAGE